MPLTADQRRRYPPNWSSEIRPRILRRAEHRCERCGAPDRVIIIRGEGLFAGLFMLPDGEIRCDRTGAVQHGADGRTFLGRAVAVVLTIAHHPDPDPANVSDDNLHALCQLCHLRLDGPLHARNAWRTRRLALRNLELFDLAP